MLRNFSINSSATPFCTKNLFEATQLWPQLMNLPFTAPCAASSIIASSSTTNGSLPPSSSTHFLSPAAALCPTLAPATALPVNVTALTPSESIRWFAVSVLPITHWNTPSGTPDSLNAVSISMPDCGVMLAGFITMTFPAIRQGAANLSACQYGKFHGIMEPMVPSGSNVTKLFLASVVSTSLERKLSPWSA